MHYTYRDDNLQACMQAIWPLQVRPRAAAETRSWAAANHTYTHTNTYAPACVQTLQHCSNMQYNTLARHQVMFVSMCHNIHICSMNQHWLHIDLYNLQCIRMLHNSAKCKLFQTCDSRHHKDQFPKNYHAICNCMLSKTARNICDLQSTVCNDCGVFAKCMRCQTKCSVCTHTAIYLNKHRSTH